MKRTRSPRPLLAALLFSPLLLLSSSCGPKLPPLYPVNGQVFFKDRPAPGALVVFHPIDKKTSNLPSRRATCARTAPSR